MLNILVPLQMRNIAANACCSGYLWARKMGKRLPMGKIPVGHATSRVATKKSTEIQKIKMEKHKKYFKTFNTFHILKPT